MRDRFAGRMFGNIVKNPMIPSSGQVWRDRAGIEQAVMENCALDTATASLLERHPTWIRDARASDLPFYTVDHRAQNALHT